jgi:hypothetical protein
MQRFPLAVMARSATTQASATPKPGIAALRKPRALAGNGAAAPRNDGEKVALGPGPRNGWLTNNWTRIPADCPENIWRFVLLVHF